MIIDDTPLARRTLRHAYEAALELVPDLPVFRDPQRSLSYAEAWSSALRVAGGLEALGIPVGQPVLLMLDNHVDNAETWLAVCLSGRIEVSINTALKGELLRHIFVESAAGAIVIEEHYVERLVEIGAIPTLRHVIVRGGQQDHSGVPQVFHRLTERYAVSRFEELRKSGETAPADIKPWDLISYSFTSGTSGRSKGVLCPHAHAFNHATAPGLGETEMGETRLVVLPQFHIAGRWGGVYNAIAHKACAFIADRFRASTFWREVREARASTTQLVGAMATFLERQPDSEEDRAHGLREVCQIPMPRDPAAWSARFNVRLATAFGSTESGCVIGAPQATDSSSGTVRAGYTLRIVDEHDQEVPDGVAGELMVRPDLPWTSSVGYLNAAQATADAWRNGWFHTGDALVRHPNGTYSFIDRIDDAVRRRGENISTGEVEYLIEQHAAVEHAAVVGVPSEYLEDEVLAVVVLRDGVSLREIDLATDLAKTMPYFMVPRFVRFIDALPLTQTGKVRKSELRREGRAGAWDAEEVGFRAAR